tara:strand:- start:976 stop:1716 length:741 start_codon:yes stop_codon:yes gene_type:complete
MRSKPITKRISLFAISLLLPALAACNQSGEYISTDGNRSKTVGTGEKDSSGAIIKQEIDEYGNLRDCGIGSSAKKLGLPRCDEIVDRRQAETDKNIAAAKDQQEKNEAYSRSLFKNKLSGSKLFTLSNGSKVRIKTRVIYNDEENSLKINAIVERVNSTAKAFEQLFIKPDGKIVMVFLDADDFELLDPMTIPLNIQEGQRANVSYRKKMGLTTDDLEGISITTRRPIRSLREYNEIKRIEIAFKP